jgi:hypothetical protein
MSFRFNTVLLSIVACGAVTLGAQDLSNYTSFTVDGKTIQIHGFFSQGFVGTNDNNWLTMNTSNGSFAMTDGGVNVSSQLTDKFRVGAQVNDRNLGQLGQWHPQLDWAYGDYKFTNWFGVRAGKVKTMMGLYNDTQDMDFLHTFALLPQSVYPTDLRDATLSHLGADIYGTISPKRIGSFSYTLYGGDRRDSLYGGYPYNLTIHGIYLHQYGGPVYGADLRWDTPLKGVLVGYSYLSEDITGTGQLNPSVALGGPNTLVPYKEWSKNDFVEQYYGQYTIGKLRIDAEHRRYLREQDVFSGQFGILTDVRAWYFAGAYRVAKRLELGSYYSHFGINWYTDVPGQVESPSESAPDRHLYDKVVTARFDLTSSLYLKIEGHLMNGYGGFLYPDGFYPQVNPQGLKPNTNALVALTGWSF